MATFKRKCFYLSGFDPRGPSFYHRLYAEQAAVRAARGEPPIAVSGRRPMGEALAGWTIDNPAETVETSYVCLRWEDLVRRGWIRNPLTLILRGFATYARYLALSDWPRVLALPRHPLITLYYPLAAMMLTPLLIAALVGGLATLLLPAWIAWPAALLAGGAAAVPLLVRIRALWLVRLFVFNDLLARGRTIPGLNERLDRFAEVIDEALADEQWDEVLLVTHSNGSILAFPLMDRLLARRAGALPARFALVTLAQCIPLVALRRDAAAYRAQIRRVAAGRFHWLDIGFPPDGACYADVDPFALGRPDRVVATLDMVSPRFFLFRSDAAYQARRRQKYELHFEYLRTGERPSPIDHLSLTAGPGTVEQKLAAFRAIA